MKYNDFSKNKSMSYSQKQVIWYVILTIVAVLFIDQASKIWVKTNMHYGQEILIFGQDWARIHFVENEGMAYGLSLGGKTGKLLLSLFRIGGNWLFNLSFSKINT